MTTISPSSGRWCRRKRGRFLADDVELVLKAAEPIPAGPIKFYGRRFVSRANALVWALGELDTWTQHTRMSDQDKKSGRSLPPSELETRLSSAAAGLRRVLRSLTYKDREVLLVVPQLRDVVVEAAVPPEDHGAEASTPPEDAKAADEEAFARLYVALGGDPADIQVAARRLKAETEASQRVDDLMAEMQWLLERLERKRRPALDVSSDGKLIDDICNVWVEILGRKISKGGGNVDGPLVRFVETCFVLLGESPTTRNAIRQSVRRRASGSMT